MTYRWDFDSTKGLTHSASSTKGYTLKDGVIRITDNTTAFVLGKGFQLTNGFNCSIEWKAKLADSSALFGTTGPSKNFIYMAYKVKSWKNPFRMVSNDGTAYMIPLGDYASKVEKMNTWRAEYTLADSTLTLKFYNASTKAWEIVGTQTVLGSSNFHFTHMFGRYEDVNVNVCLNGEVDYIEIVAKEITEG